MSIVKELTKHKISNNLDNVKVVARETVVSAWPLLF